MKIISRKANSNVFRLKEHQVEELSQWHNRQIVSSSYASDLMRIDIEIAFDGRKFTLELTRQEALDLVEDINHHFINEKKTKK